MTYSMGQARGFVVIRLLSLLLFALIWLPADTFADSPPVSNGKLPRLLDLGADKCIPCKMMAPILEELKKEYAGQMDVQFIDVWKNEQEAARYGVKMIPTQIFFDAQGKELFRRSGFIGRDDILATWKRLGYDFREK